MKNTDKLVSYWHKLADEKWKTAQGLMKIKRYADALFFCHLVLEAELKARVVLATQENAPFIHHLPKLSELAKMTLSDDQKTSLKEIMTFNISARYADYKFAFYKKATKKYAEKYFKIADDLRLWTRKNTLVKK